MILMIPNITDYFAIPEAKNVNAFHFTYPDVFELNL